jgi:uncharacterized protein YndB with AHSA1/START domain
VPTVRRSRTIAAAPADVWRVLGDPHHLPRWWPRVTRVEGAALDSWTTVLQTAKGKAVRADYRVVSSDPERARVWAQETEDSPFERFLREAVTEARMTPAQDGTEVVLELRQRLRGMARLGGFLVRGAARRTLDEALDGLERVCAR